MKKQVGIIVGRFQVAELHDGHKYLIQWAIDLCDHVIIFLGHATEYFTEKNPIPYYHREWMLKEAFPNVQIKMLPDIPLSDEEWVKNLEKNILSLIKSNETPILFGSRDSFIPIYEANGGRFRINMVEGIGNYSGTEDRLQIKNIFHNSVDFRKGIIYTVYNKTINNEI